MSQSHAKLAAELGLSQDEIEEALHAEEERAKKLRKVQRDLGAHNTPGERERSQPGLRASRRGRSGSADQGTAEKTVIEEAAIAGGTVQSTTDDEAPTQNETETELEHLWGDVDGADGANASASGNDDIGSAAEDDAEGDEESPRGVPRASANPQTPEELRTRRLAYYS